jgi:AraC family transcriptional regulator
MRKGDQVGSVGWPYIGRMETKNPVGQALWFIEAHFGEDISLEDVAAVAGVSRFWLSRAFAPATGHTVMGYVRARRLTEAAKALAAGAVDILAVALAARYGSHEAFTRAFRDQFGETPERVRALGSVTGLRLTEAISLAPAAGGEFEEPRLVMAKPRLLAGLNERYDGTSMPAIAAQWQRFVPHIGHIPGQVGYTTYGVLHNGDGSGACDYLCAVEVSGFGLVPAEWARLTLPARRYALFVHRSHVSTIRSTWNAAWNQWAPGKPVAEAPEFERYTESFDPITGMGGVEIWIPLEE